MYPRLQITILAAALLAISCGDRERGGGQAPATLHAVIEQPDAEYASVHTFGPNAPETTRTSIVADQTPHPIVWSANDLISIHFDTDVNGGRRIYSLSQGAGTAQGDFTYAQIYDTSDTGVTMSADPPTSYTSLFAGFPGAFVTISARNSELLLEPPREIFLGLDNIKDFPLVGTGGADGSISFACPFGMMHLPVTGTAQIESLYIDTTEQQAEISGRFSIDPQSYTATFVESVVGSQFSISWNSTSPVQLTSSPTSFYAILPPGTYEAGTTFRFVLASGSSVTMTTKLPFTVTRANILNLPAVDINP